MKIPGSRRSAVLGCAVLVLGAAWPSSGLDGNIPDNLVLDVRLFEARSTRPDFQAMENLSFFVDTDGRGISEQQWLATIVRKVPDCLLSTLARETVSADGETARFEISKRQRSFALSVDLGSFLDRGTFLAPTRVELARSGSVLREFDREIELRVGQTFVWAGRDLELSSSDYVSHFRDYDDADHRSELYQVLRNYTVFLVLAVTPRLASSAESAAPVEVRVEGDLVPKLASPLGVPLTGELVLGLVLDDSGQPVDVHVVRSSVPELNPRILGEASQWRFPGAAGQRALLELSLRAEP